MSVICQCMSCKSKYQVADRYAGRTIKCPKCSAAVVVPAAAQPASPTDEPARPRPGPAPAVAEQSSDRAPPADDGLGFVTDVPAAAGQSFAADEPADDAVDDGVFIPGLALRPSKGVLPHRSKKKKQPLPAWLITTIAAVGVAAIVGIAVTSYLTSNRKPDSRSTTGASARNDGNKAGKREPKVPVLNIEWPENQRAGASLLVNDAKTEIALTGPIVIPLPPSKEQYHFRLERRGFQVKTFARASQEDDQSYTVSEWEPVARGIDWEQDFDAAKKMAAGNGKNVLVLFDASDTAESNFASSRFAEAIALRTEFRERAQKEYVCVYIDNPQNAEAQGRVENADRNRKLTEKFCITIFPTVVVTDPRGRQFGILEDYRIKGINAFLELMDKWAADRRSLFGLLAKIDAMPQDSPNFDLVAKALDFLEMNKLDRFYRDAMKELTARLPKGEGRPVTKELADMWAERFERAGRNADDVKKVMDEFDQWKKTRTFKDHDLGAKLHFFAAVILARLDLRQEAAGKCQDGLALQPHDPGLRSLLQRFSQVLTGEHGDLPVGSGTGFCIAQGNYVLTNHHVIDGAKKIKVRLNGEKEMYPAKLVVDNETGDMALLKIELPADRKLVPIPLAEAGVKIGEDVCALGFPGVMSQNITLTLTKGVVSTLPAPDDDDGYIATDCKVNPGNSGGPLCSFSGGIAGMVTAKSHISSREDSYGLVIPVARLRKFLVANLPPDSGKLTQAPRGAANLKLSDLAEIVAPSVVYIENVQ